MPYLHPRVMFRGSAALLLAIACSVGVLSTPLLSHAQGMQPLQGYVVTVPAGTYMMGTVQSGVSSATARAGDRVVVGLNAPIMSGGSVALPAGSMAEGQVISVTPAGRAERNGQLDIRFNSAILPNGQRVPISARIQTEDGSGILKGGTAKGRFGQAALKTGGGAAMGAALGTAMGPLSGGSVGRGAIYGTALGAGLGALAAGVGKGEDVALNPGQALNIVLDAPLSASSGGNQPMMQQNYYAPQQTTYGQQQYGQNYGAQPAYGQQPNVYGGDAGNSSNFYTPNTNNSYNSNPYGY